MYKKFFLALSLTACLNFTSTGEVKAQPAGCSQWTPMSGGWKYNPASQTCTNCQHCVVPGTSTVSIQCNCNGSSATSMITYDANQCKHPGICFVVHNENGKLVGKCEKRVWCAQ